MIAIQIGLIVFLIFVLVIVWQDEYRRRRQTRKSARLNRFWDKGKDRRRFFRLNTEIDVLYEVISNQEGRKQTVLSRNISLGGINLALNEKLFPNTTLKLQLNLPDQPRPILTQGKIVWVKEVSERFSREKEQRLFATGIKFTQMKAEDEAILHSFINQRLKNVTEQS